jgi:hypothetical protein
MTTLQEKLESLSLFTKGEIVGIKDVIEHIDDTCSIFGVNVTYVSGYLGEEDGLTDVKYFVRISSTCLAFEPFMVCVIGKYDSWNGTEVNWYSTKVVDFVKKEERLMYRNVYTDGTNTFETDWFPSPVGYED